MSHCKYEHPRHGSLGFLPKKRSKKKIFKSNHFSNLLFLDYPSLYFFLGYKVGMTHLIRYSQLKTSRLFKQEICDAVTIIECPPLFIYGLAIYTYSGIYLQKINTIINYTHNKNKNIFKLKNNHSVYKFEKKKFQAYLKNYLIIRILCHSQMPKKNKKLKTNYSFEIQLEGGNSSSKLECGLKLIGKELHIDSITRPDDFIDLVSISRGKGLQGVIKRWGITRLPRKTHRGLRKVACIGAWTPSRVSWTVARSGQMGYHKRTALNLKVLKIGIFKNISFNSTTLFDVNKININCMGGFPKYGIVRNDYIIIKGSVLGTPKRPVLIKKYTRNSVNNRKNEKIEIKTIDTSSKIGHGKFQTSSEKLTAYETKKLSIQELFKRYHND